MTLFEEIHGQVGRIGNHLIAEFLSVVVRYIGEEIEGTVRHIYLETGYLTGQLHNQVATAFKGLTHLLNAALVAREGCHRGFLRNRAGTRRVLALQLVAGLGQPQGSGDDPIRQPVMA